MSQIDTKLIEKYNVPAPRYTSYPTVPNWKDETFTLEQWKLSVASTFKHTNEEEGISLYVHLPYCESLCTYCGCNTRITVNHGVEEPYVQHVLKEWQLYLELFDEKPIIRELHLGGGTPTFFSAENLKLLVLGILNEATVHPGARFSFEAHPNNTKLCHLKTLYDLGFRRLSLGIQDFDPLVQDTINRVQPFENVKNCVSLAREVGYESINFDLVYGLPKQTVKGVKDTIAKVISLDPDRIAFYSYAHVPWVKPGQRKFTEKDLPANEEKRRLYELGREMFLHEGMIEVGMDHFAKPSDSLAIAMKQGELHRNFMGYTEGRTHLMVGLGVSSISDSWSGFAQNAKTVEEYMDNVSSGKFAIFKGHILNEEEIRVRSQILDIMCNLKMEWNENEIYRTSILDRLEELRIDGLLEVSDKGIVVKEEGRPFLRNICMAFDSDLWRKKPDSQVYSMAI